MHDLKAESQVFYLDNFKRFASYAFRQPPETHFLQKEKK